MLPAYVDFSGGSLAESADTASFTAMLHLVATYPAYTLLPASFILAIFSVSLTPSFVSLIGLLTCVLIYTREASVFQNPISGRVLSLWLTLTASISISNSQPSIHALSTPSTSIASLVLLSGMSSLIALAPIIARHSLSPRRSQMQVLIFPTLWTITWLGVSWVSPLGRLATWHPLPSAESYQWTQKFFGFSGIDWIVAAWATVSASLLENIIGTNEIHTALVDVHGNGTQKPTRDVPKSLTPLTGFLLALIGPSFFINTLPLPPFSSSTTPLKVACILPQHSDQSQLKRFLDETTKYTNQAKILLWPEGAVTFETDQEKTDALEEVQKVAHVQMAWIGVSFHARVPGSGSERDGLHRNGLALVGPDGLQATYYKRNLVPIVESFSQVASNDGPSIYTIDLPRPKGESKEDWGETRSIPLSASICLDFSSPLTSLPSRPALILAPARTWHIEVGRAMYELARARGYELGAEVLWCDGGAGGLSGVAGDLQVGPGSWVKTIGIPYPSDERRTLYGMCGDWLMLAVFFGIPGIVLTVQRRGNAGFAINWRDRGQRILTRIRGITHRASPQTESLIDAPNDPIGS